MILPSREQYAELAREHKYIPLYTRIMGDTLTPVLVYQAIRKLSPYSYLLESVQQNEKLGRFSFIGFDPVMIFESQANKIKIKIEDEDPIHITGNPFELLQKKMEEFRPAILKELAPYNGGMVGYFGYDTIRHIEDIPDSNPEEISIPESLCILPRGVIVFDHLYQAVTIIEQVEVKDDFSYERGAKEITKILEIISSANQNTSNISLPQDVVGEPQFTSNISREAYEKAVDKAKHYIREGDIFQVVLSQRFTMEYLHDPFEVYRSLRRINPSPYLYFMDYPGFQIAGSSPEVLIKREGEKLTLRPIAGTRKRGENEEEDRILAEDLLNDPKEIAEHMMLVDLGRNDLGRICEFGSVKPTAFRYIENYSHVMHIVTNLEGVLAKGMTNSELIQSTFPAGTLSGAPKVRAMEIIDELEVSRRGFYGGAVVNVDFAGNFDACIGIRSVVMKEGKAFIQAGAGIVADSVPATEYEECINKAKAVMKAIQLINPEQE
ncbi:MAG: anthranilate synthase component I [Proteobacteria bacterium]|nr:anthranilate synthase component I [Pseudomonadota bacterium]